MKAISIRDRDDETDGSVGADLIDKGHSTADSFLPLKWRRRHLENYLLVPAAVARLSGTTVAQANQLFADNFGIALPENVVASDVVMTVRDARGKEIFTEGAASVQSVLGLSRYDVANGLNPDEIGADVLKFLDILSTFSRP